MNAPARPAPQVRLADLSDSVEAARLDAFVRDAERGTAFHLPAWLRAVEQGCGQRGHMLVVEKGGSFTGVLPLSEIHSPLFGRALVSSGFAVGGGILAEDEASEEALAEAGWALAERLACPELELRGGPFPQGWTPRDGVYANFSRPIAEDEEGELTSIPRRHRAEVRKGLAHDLAVETGTSERLRAAHYRLYAINVHNHGTPVFPRALFDATLDGFGEDADIVLVSHRGTPVSSVLNIYFEGSAMLYWGGGTPAARKLRANERLYFEVMNHARRRGCTRFDFGRSKIGTGAYRYKKNWGIKPEPLVYATRTAEGVPAREINPSSPRYRFQVEAWKRLPLFVANRLGPMIARGLG